MKLRVPIVIGLVFMFVKLMVWSMKISIGLCIAAFALTAWLMLAMFLMVPGAGPGVRRSMNQASRTARRGLGLAL